MDTGQLATAIAVITASAIALVEAVKPWVPSDAKPVLSIAFGAILGAAYIWATPPEYQAAFLVLLAGATGTATVAVAKRIGGEGAGS